MASGYNRRKFCGMMAAVDEGIAKIMNAMDRLGYLDNLITLFVSDNGGPNNKGKCDIFDIYSKEN